MQNEGGHRCGRAQELVKDPAPLVGCQHGRGGHLERYDGRVGGHSSKAAVSVFHYADLALDPCSFRRVDVVPPCVAVAIGRPKVDIEV